MDDNTEGKGQISPVAAAIALLRQGGFLDPHKYLTTGRRTNTKAMKRVREVLSSKPYVSVLLFKSLKDIVPDTVLIPRRAGSTERTSLLRAFCDKVLLAWYARHPNVSAADGLALGATTQGGPTSAVLLALSVNDRLARVQTRGKAVLTDAQASAAIDAMGEYLRREQYASGVAIGLEYIEKAIDTNAAWIRFFQRLVDWDVKGWLCTCIVGYCSLKLYRLCRYTMAHAAVVQQRTLIQAYKEKLQRKAELLQAATPSAPPPSPPSIGIEDEDDWETIEHGRHTPSGETKSAASTSADENKNENEEDENHVCGICLEDMRDTSPFQQEEREEKIFDTHLSFPKLRWYPRRVLAALSGASKRAALWSKVYVVVVAVAVYLGGRKARYGFYASALLLCRKIYLEHWEEISLDVNDETMDTTESIDNIDSGIRLPGISGDNCQHRFHGACLRRWAEHNPTCPMCRAPLSGNNNQPDEHEHEHDHDHDTEPTTRPPDVPSTSVFSIDDEVHLGSQRGKILRRRATTSSYDVLFDDGNVLENVPQLNLRRFAYTSAMSYRYMRRRQLWRSRFHRRSRWGWHSDPSIMDYFWYQQDLRHHERQAYREGVLDATITQYDDTIQRQRGIVSPPLTSTASGVNATGSSTSSTGETKTSTSTPTDSIIRMEHDQGSFTQELRGNGNAVPSTTWYADSAAWSDPVPSTTSWSQVLRQNIQSSSQRSSSSSSSSSSGWSSSSSGSGSSGSW